MVKKLSTKERRKLMKQELIKRTKESAQRGQTGLYFKVPDDMEQYRPEKGDHFVDFIPYLVGPYDPKLDEGSPSYYLEVYTHPPEEGVDAPIRVCNKRMYNKPCPRCDHRAILQKEGAEESLIKALYPKRRELYNIRTFDKGLDPEKVMIFEVSYHYMGKHLQDLIEGPVRPGMTEIETTIDIASPDEDGRTIGFKIGSKTVQGTTFPEYTGHRLIERDYSISDELLDQAVALDELLIRSSYEQQYREYWGEDPEGAGTRTGTETDTDGDDIDTDDTSDTPRILKPRPLSKRKLELNTDDDDSNDGDVGSNDDDDSDDNLDLDSMDKKALIRFMKSKRYKIKGFNKMDEDELRLEIEYLIEEED